MYKGHLLMLNSIYMFSKAELFTINLLKSNKIQMFLVENWLFYAPKIKENLIKLYPPTDPQTARNIHIPTQSLMLLQIPR